jgi:transposase
MAYREVDMWEIQNVLRRIGRGESKSAVARASGYSRKTIRRYVETARGLGWEPGQQEPSEELAAEVYSRLRPVPVERAPGAAERLLLPHRERIVVWLKPEPGEKRGLRLTKVHRLLAREGVHVAYTSLHRFAVKHCGFSDRRRLTVRLPGCEPGELAEVDFGRLGLIADRESGRKRVVHALIVTLVFSRHQYVHITHSQKTRDLIAGLEAAWTFFGGVTRRVVLDNLAAAVTRADRYDPVFQRTFEEYARHRGFVIDAARPGRPRDKPHVERNVAYVRDSLFRGEEWRDREHLQREAIRWCLEVAGTRVHGTTRQRPLAVFENTERATLQPLGRPRFDPPHWGRCKVHPDRAISFLKALYSVPTRHVGRRVWVRADSRLVRIYADGRLVKTHERQPPGGRSIDPNDYPEELTPYSTRDPRRLIRQARKQGPHLGRFMGALLSEPFPWAKLRQGQRLMRLGERYGWARVEAACRRALAFELINVKRVEAIIRADLDHESLPPEPDRPAGVTSPPLRFQRPAHSFTHSPSALKGGDPS